MQSIYFQQGFQQVLLHSRILLGQSVRAVLEFPLWREHHQITDYLPRTEIVGHEGLIKQRQTIFMDAFNKAKKFGLSLWDETNYVAIQEWLKIA